MVSRADHPRSEPYKGNGPDWIARNLSTYCLTLRSPRTREGPCWFLQLLERRRWAGITRIARNRALGPRDGTALFSQNNPENPGYVEAKGYELGCLRYEEPVCCVTVRPARPFPLIIRNGGQGDGQQARVVVGAARETAIAPGECAYYRLRHGASVNRPMIRVTEGRIWGPHRILGVSGGRRPLMYRCGVNAAGCLK